jgi:hypothetical protein
MRVREPPLSLAADGTDSAQQPQFKKLKLTGEKRKLTGETKAPLKSAQVYTRGELNAMDKELLIDIILEHQVDLSNITNRHILPESKEINTHRSEHVNRVNTNTLTALRGQKKKRALRDMVSLLLTCPTVTLLTHAEAGAEHKNYATDDEYLFQQIDEPGQPKYLLTTSAISTVKQSWQLLRIADTRPAATDVVAMCNLCRSINWGIIHVDNLLTMTRSCRVFETIAEVKKGLVKGRTLQRLGKYIKHLCSHLIGLQHLFEPHDVKSVQSATERLQKRSPDGKHHEFRSFLDEPDDDKPVVPKSWHPRDAIYTVRPWLLSFEDLDFVILDSTCDKQVNNQLDFTTRVIYQSIISLLDSTLF